MAEKYDLITFKFSALDLETATTFHFTQLPNEFLEHLFTHYLSLHDGLNLGKACHQLYNRFRASCRVARKRLVVVPTDYDYYFDRLHTLSSCSFSATKRLLDENERVNPTDLFRLQSFTLTSVKTVLKPLLTSLLPGLTCLELFGRPPLIRDDLQELVEAVNALQNLRSLKLYLLFEYEKLSESTSELGFLAVRDQALNGQIMDFCSAFLVHLQPSMHLCHLTLALLGDHFSAWTSQEIPSFEVPTTFLALLRQLTSISLSSSSSALPKAFCDLLELIRLHGNEQLLARAGKKRNSLKVALTLRPIDCFEKSFYTKGLINPSQAPLNFRQTVELLETGITALKMNSPITDFGTIDSQLSSQIGKLFSLHQLGTIALDCSENYTRIIEPNIKFRNVINSLSCWVAECYGTAEKSGASYQTNPHTLLIYLPPPDAFYSKGKWRLGLSRKRYIRCFGWFSLSNYNVSPPQPLASVRTVEIVPFRTVVEADVVKQFFLDVAFPQLRRLVVAFDQKEQCELCLVNGGSYQDCGRELVSGFQLLPATVQQLEISFEFCYAHLGRTVVRYSSLKNMLKNRREKM